MISDKSRRTIELFTICYENFLLLFGYVSPNGSFIDSFAVTDDFPSVTDDFPPVTDDFPPVTDDFPPVTDDFFGSDLKWLMQRGHKRHLFAFSRLRIVLFTIGNVDNVMPFAIMNIANQ
ncbi:hypothetical protein EWH99_08155 [Sporolactobacillus sp. THM7-7]|nr:hypothetical protein EWH99_08155 [Sporolactobacillus sp. THM7-7]